MVKDFLITRTPPTIDRERLQQYLEYKHAPLALSLPLLAKVTIRYTMNHAQDQVSAGLGLYPPIEGLATIVEHIFGEGISGLHDDAQYKAQVRPDEMFMISELMDGAPQFLPIDEELPIFKIEASSVARMFDFVRRPKSVSRAAFLEKLVDDGIWAASHSRYRAAVGRRVHSIVGSGSGAADFGADQESFDAVIETWITDIPALVALMDEQRARRMLFCDATRSFSAFTDERWLRGSADAFGPRAMERVEQAPEVIS